MIYAYDVSRKEYDRYRVGDLLPIGYGEKGILYYRKVFRKTQDPRQIVRDIFEQDYYRSLFLSICIKNNQCLSIQNNHYTIQNIFPVAEVTLKEYGNILDDFWWQLQDISIIRKGVFFDICDFCSSSERSI